MQFSSVQASSVQSELKLIPFELKMVLAQMVSGQGRQHPAVTGCGRGTIQPRQNPAANRNQPTATSYGHDRNQPRQNRTAECGHSKMFSRHNPATSTIRTQAESGREQVPAGPARRRGSLADVGAGGQPRRPGQRRREVQWNRTH